MRFPSPFPSLYSLSFKTVLLYIYSSVGCLTTVINILRFCIRCVNFRHKWPRWVYIVLRQINSPSSTSHRSDCSSTVVYTKVRMFFYHFNLILKNKSVLCLRTFLMSVGTAFLIGRYRYNFYCFSQALTGREWLWMDFTTSPSSKKRCRAWLQCGAILHRRLGITLQP